MPQAKHEQVPGLVAVVLYLVLAAGAFCVYLSFDAWVAVPGPILWLRPVPLLVACVFAFSAVLAAGKALGRTAAPPTISSAELARELGLNPPVVASLGDTTRWMDVARAQSFLGSPATWAGLALLGFAIAVGLRLLGAHADAFGLLAFGTLTLGGALAVTAAFGRRRPLPDPDRVLCTECHTVTRFSHLDCPDCGAPLPDRERIAE